MNDIVERLRTQEVDLFRLQDEAADTIETLREELQAIHKEASSNQKWAFLEWKQRAKDTEEQLAEEQQLRRSIEAFYAGAVIDAKRYRWLRQDDETYLVAEVFDQNVLEDLDASIDAAMKGEE
jgi:hypothetical protein